MEGNVAGKAEFLGQIRKVLEFLGVTTAGGAGFAALAFGVGYLATKHHDYMLGVPTTTTDQTTYVRTGALFFSQTLHDLVAFVSATVVASPVLVAIAILVGVVAIVWRQPWDRLVALPWWSRARDIAYVVFCGLVLAFSLWALPYHLAPLDAGNKNLLFETRPVQGVAEKVNTALRRPDGERALHLRYGAQWSILLALGIGLATLRRWRTTFEAQINAAPQSTAFVIRFMDRVVQPASGAVLLALLATTPATYGVLAMSTSLPCVQLYGNEDTDGENDLGLPGFLLSDLSSEHAKVSILRWDAEQASYFVDFHPRDSLHQIEVRACGVRNPISRVIGGGARPREGS